MDIFLLIKGLFVCNWPSFRNSLICASVICNNGHRCEGTCQCWAPWEISRRSSLTVTLLHTAVSLLLPLFHLFSGSRWESVPNLCHETAAQTPDPDLPRRESFLCSPVNTIISYPNCIWESACRELQQRDLGQHFLPKEGESDLQKMFAT